MKRADAGARFVHDAHPLTDHLTSQWCAGTQPPTKVGFPSTKQASVSVYRPSTDIHLNRMRNGDRAEVYIVDTDTTAEVLQYADMEIVVMKAAVDGLIRAGYPIELPLYAKY